MVEKSQILRIVSCLRDNFSKHGYSPAIAVRDIVIAAVCPSVRHDNLSKRIDLNNVLHVACNYHYPGWVLTWKYLKQGFWGEILVFG